MGDGGGLTWKRQVGCRAESFKIKDQRNCCDPRKSHRDFELGPSNEDETAQEPCLR